MQREEKQLEASLEALIQRVQELKNSITSFIMKLEHEYTTLSWPTVLDNFALISGQINSMNRLLKNEKTPVFRNHILLPLILAPERDPALEKLTEGRVVAFNHEVVPDYLRTKPEPDAEEKMNQLQAKVNSFTPDNIQKQINALNKITANLIETINNHREEAESEMNQKSQPPQTCNQADTHTLIAATAFGKNIKPRRPEPTPSPQQQQATQQANPQGPGGGSMKAGSMIKTNIKSANSTHPYSRN